MKNKELIRLQSVIENDRINCIDNFTELLLKDLRKILSDYFDFDNDIMIEINKQDRFYNVIISLKTLRIKNFKTLQKN